MRQLIFVPSELCDKGILLEDAMESDSTTVINALDGLEDTEKEVEQAAATPTSPPASSSSAGRVEVSAQTITRMMGIASTTDLKLLEGRVDLLTSKVSSLLIKVDRVLTMFSAVPTPSDIGRLEIQLGSIKSMVREALEAITAASDAPKEKASKESTEEQSRKLIDGIRSNSES